MSEKVFTMVHALKSLAPNALWAFEEETYESLEWRDEVIKKPTKKAIEAEILRLTQAAEAEEIARLEAEAATQAAKESALAKLAKLGLTQEEAKAVIGL